MRSATLNFRPCYNQIDETTATEFLFAHKEELMLPDRTAVSQVIEHLFTHGGILGAYDQQHRMQAMLGFFFGEPSQQYINKEVLFVYVTVISASYRFTRVFREGIIYSFQQFQQMGMAEIRMQAHVDDRYTNKLYSHFAHSMGEGTTLRGARVNTYGNKLDAALDRLQGIQPAIHKPNLSLNQSAYAIQS